MRKQFFWVVAAILFLHGAVGADEANAASANVTNGNLSHSQALFSTSGSPLSTSVTLYYSSLSAKAAPLGLGWSHNYEIALEDAGSGAKRFRQGERARLYAVSGTTYVSQDGDFSTLANVAGNWLLTEQSGTSYHFDPSGKLTAIADRYGNTASFAYNGINLSTVTDPAGRVTSFSYDATNKLTAITDPQGNPYSFSYSGNQLVSVTHPDGGAWSYTYDANGFLLGKADPNSQTVTYGYDAQHRVTTATDPAGKTRSYSYPTNPDAVRTTTFTEKDGGAWLYTYDTQKGTLTSKTDPLGNATSYTYDTNGNMLTKTEPGNLTTSYTYDGFGNVTSTTNPLNQTTTYTYNGFNQVLTTTGPQGTVTNSYDANGNLTSTNDLAGATITYVYDARGRMTSTTNAKNQTTTFAYGTNGILSSATDPTGATTTFTYDANGNMLTRTDAAGKTTTFAYDSRNRLISTADPLGNVTTSAYDPMGNRTSTTDANGNTTTFTYNYQGQVVEVRDALGNVTRYEYSASGCASCGGGVDKLIGLTDAKGQKTSFQYDLLGRLTGETDPLAMATSYGYDANGSLTLKTDANNIAIAYSYDALKRLTGKSYPDATSEVYTYDAQGNLATAVNEDISYTYAYDSTGRVTGVSDSRGYTIAYQYDTLGNRTQATIMPGTPDERVTTYTYDNGNRPQTIASPAGTFTFGYDTLGRRTSLAYPNQITTSYTYDDDGRLTSLSHQAAGTNIASFAYTLDKVNNRLSRTSIEAQNYLYDLVYRLLTVTAGNPEGFSYDAVGNRQSGPGAKDTSYLYNAGNQMTQGRKLAYAYDNAGNQTTKTVPIASDKSWTQTWDYQNRLVKVEKIKGAEKKTVTFSYDPMGRRIGKQFTSIIDGVTKTSSWSYVYDNDSIVLEMFTDETGTVTKTFYTHGAGIDEHLAMERGGSSYYYHADGLGSIVSITDASRNVVQSYEYDSFGMVKPSTAFANRYTYTGREWDKETGLYYYRARYYDPMEGRFISKDPIGFAGGDVTLYGYVQNNPVNWIDPSGFSGSKPGGPYHPPNGVSFGCKGNDSCPEIMAKIWVIERMLYSHMGWDFIMPAPRGENRHAQEISELFNSLSTCEKLKKLKCDSNNCPTTLPNQPPSKDVLGAILSGLATAAAVAALAL